ncbi:UNVERIFIED_CONTAM: aryl-phospho-beta-D-glucosidase BglC (GH1 family) [Acetivibrio alkalicellulosi]
MVLKVFSKKTLAMLCVFMLVWSLFQTFFCSNYSFANLEEVPIGEAVLPSDFEDGTRQGWNWNIDSGIDEPLTLEEVNGSMALSWEYKAVDEAWEGSPRLDVWKDDLVRGDSDYVSFDLYIEPANVTQGSVEVFLIFQPPTAGWWVQAPRPLIVDFEDLDSAEQIDQGLYYYSAKIDINNISSIEDDTFLRNMILIFANNESDFEGRVYIDNIAFGSYEKEEDPNPIEFKHLLGNDSVRKPSQAGALQLVDYNGQLTLAGEDGTPIQLRGMSTHGLQWFGEIVNENAFAALANDWESNVIRLAMYVGENGYATNPRVKDLVYKGIELAFEHDMYVIVDWHVHAPGDPRAEIYSGAYDFFEELAEYYKDHEKNHYIIWELANEPSPNSSGGPGIPNNEEGWQAVKEYAEPIVEMLREKGDNIIIVGNPNWSQRPDLSADDPIDAENIMYTVHFYTGTHMPSNDSYPVDTPNSSRNNVMSNARYALENGVAVFATEWGVSEATGDGGPYLDEADVWIEFLNENYISWTNWSLTNKNEISGSFTPFELNKTEATSLDPGDDQVWAIKELSLSGEYVRARIKGIEYEPINRKAFTKVLWDFENETTQGFVVNPDSPIDTIELANVDNTLRISGLDQSNDISDGNFWANARISSDNWGQEVDILGGEEISFVILVESPSTVSVAAVPQGPAAGWANPVRAIQLTEDDFEVFGDKYRAVLTITKDDSPSLEVIAMDPDDNTLTNIILFIGTEGADTIYIDSITVSGTIVEIPVIHDPKGESKLPSDFEDGTRQGWDWNPESGVKTALTIEEANGSNAISWEFAYPEVKPSDGWASAPRLELWKGGMVRGENDFVVFDLYVDPIRGIDHGSMAINVVFQPPDAGWWAQSLDVFKIDFTALDDEAVLTEDDLYHYEVKMSIRHINGIEDDMELRNMILIFAEDDYTYFAGRLYLDNIRFEKDDVVNPEPPAPTPVRSGGGRIVSTPQPTEEPVLEEKTEQETEEKTEQETEETEEPIDEDVIEQETEEMPGSDGDKIFFSDVSGWYEESVNLLAQRNIIIGKSKGIFAPYDNVTRAEFAQILANLAQADLSVYEQSVFEDVHSTDWFNGAVQWAYEKGIVKGYNGNFDPNANISRQDMAVMIKLYAENIVNYDFQNGEELDFADDNQISEYAKPAVYAMRNAGIITGRGNNVFDPKANASRAEAATMIALLIDILED